MAADNHYADVVDTKAFKDAESDTLQAVRRVYKAVTNLTQAVQGLDVKGEFADTWKQAVTNFDRTSADCKRNVEDLAQAVATHGRNTDSANTNAAEGYRKLAQAAQGGLV
jgi:uncharacterized protein YukE